MKKITVSILAIGLVLSTATLCMGEIEQYRDIEPDDELTIASFNEKVICNQDQAKWTFMVYLSGDNNLQNIPLHPSKGKIGWMEAVGSNENLNIVYQFDSYDYFEGTHRYYVNNGSELIESLEEQNTGDPEVLISFVDWSCNNYPADKYCLVLWGHGVGWRNGFCYDETNDMDYLSMDELKYAMNEIKGNLGKNIDIILFDSCQMGMLEVYYQIRNTVDVCIGSEALLHEYGCNYHMILNKLKTDPDADAITFADYIVDESASYYSNCYMHVTMAAFHEETLAANVVSKLDTFAVLLEGKFSTYRKEIKEAIDNTVSYNGEGGYITHYKDLYNFTQEINKRISDGAIQQAALDLMSEIDSSIIREEHYGWGGSHGVSIYLPTFSLRYPYDPSYEDLDLSVQTHWDEFINKCKQLVLNNNEILSGSSIISSLPGQSLPSSSEMTGNFETSFVTNSNTLLIS